MTTEKQIKANKQNSISSTGPQTLEGKQASAKNATTHGIFAQEAVIQTGDGQENVDDYAALHAGLMADFKPEGQMENLIVEKIAVNYWRLRRLVRYETGEVREGLDGFIKLAISNFYKNDPMTAYSNQSTPIQPAMYYYEYTDEVTESEIQAQEKTLDLISNEKVSLEDNHDALEYVFRWKVHPDEEFDNLPTGWQKKSLKFLAQLSPQQKGKIRREIRERDQQILSEMQEVRKWRLRFDRLSRTLALPRADLLDKVIKYETALERSIFRNIAMLKSLQQERSI